MASTEVERINDKTASLETFVDGMKPMIAQALPRHLNGDRMARLALTVVRQSVRTAKPGKSLAECAPESFVGSLLTAAALGLEPGINGEAYLVPYRNECTLIVGYQGFAKLFWQHPLAHHLDAQAVHERDEFDYHYGARPDLVHKPYRGADGRGKITHYWAAASTTSGGVSFVVLTAEEVKRLRGGKEGPSGDIPDPMHWMERKTPLRQLFKLIPKTPTMGAALAVDEQSGAVLLTRQVPRAIGAGEPVDGLPPTQTQILARQASAERLTADDIRRQAERARAQAEGQPPAGPPIVDADLPPDDPEWQPPPDPEAERQQREWEARQRAEAEPPADGLFPGAG